MSNKKTALITGASKGIGYELARLLARDSYRLVLVSRNEENLKEIQEKFEKEYKSEVNIIAKDLSLPNAALEIFEELQNKHITVDLLLNNAGIGDFGNLYKEDFRKISQIMQINIVALTELTRLFLEIMVKRNEGKILNVSSLAAFQPGPYMAVYYASKAYVQSFSEAIANELKGTGVTITTLCPGPTKSRFQSAIGSENFLISKLNLMSSAEDVAKYAYEDLLAGKIISIPGVLNTSIVYIARIVPWDISARIVRKLQELNRNIRFKIFFNNN